ncbi:hypothetical protein HETIRDRAFT_314458 [Heterobasidion irregulare TC 32-1]|uniref:Uncharacterized protein n=1 Tax=Heterobasidion irregulare (strain TC 32-1) TaxID=747525 RepID=W4KHE6_HETIT|nr:uncharacterized protein HETIRDRAFT_314458 [Heterobasidion irregulare TC 32-1]ETW84481.1 hypothetical protein HETIRDRAFT_314458 [Heterobasidion irregulare TC 32-1]
MSKDKSTRERSMRGRWGREQGAIRRTHDEGEEDRASDRSIYNRRAKAGENRKDFVKKHRRGSENANLDDEDIETSSTNNNNSDSSSSSSNDNNSSSSSSSSSNNNNSSTTPLVTRHALAPPIRF